MAIFAYNDTVHSEREVWEVLFQKQFDESAFRMRDQGAPDEAQNRCSSSPANYGGLGALVPSSVGYGRSNRVATVNDHRINGVNSHRRGIKERKRRGSVPEIVSFLVASNCGSDSCLDMRNGHLVFTSSPTERIVGRCGVDEDSERAIEDCEPKSPPEPKRPGPRPLSTNEAVAVFSSLLTDQMPIDTT